MFMPADSKAADDWKIELIEHWCDLASVDISTIPQPYLNILIVAAHEAFERYQLAIVEPDCDDTESL